MKFSHGEIVELKGKVRGRISVGFLLVRQSDIKADGWCARFGSPAVGRFHDAWAAAGRDHIVADAIARLERSASLGSDPPEAQCCFIPARRLLGRARHSPRW